MLRDLKTKIKVALGLIAQNATTTKLGASVDVADFGSAVFLALIGNSADTLSGSVKIEVAIEESEDNSTFTACADADVDAAVAGGASTGTVAVIDAPAEDSLVLKAAYKGNKQYARMCIKFIGTHTNGTPVAIANLQANAEKLPQ